MFLWVNMKSVSNMHIGATGFCQAGYLQDMKMLLSGAAVFIPVYAGGALNLNQRQRTMLSVNLNVEMSF